MNPLKFDRINGSKHENHILFPLGSNPFDLCGSKIRKTHKVKL